MTQIKIDQGKVEIITSDKERYIMTWQTLTEIEEAIKTLRDLNAKKTYSRLDIEF